MNREFYADRPNENWLTDVTAFKYYDGPVIKKLYLLAHQKRMSVPVVSFDCGNDGMASIFDLREGMPENPIIDESIRLYEEEIGL